MATLDSKNCYIKKNYKQVCVNKKNYEVKEQKNHRRRNIVT